MTTTAWVGNSVNTSQTVTLTVNAVGVGGTLSAVINGKPVTYTCVSGDTPASAASAWQALLSARTAPPEFQEVAWTVVSNVITGIAKNAGTPFYGTGTGTGGLTKTDGGSANSTLVQTVANVSQNDPGNAQNWLRNGLPSLPQNGDDVILQNSSVDISVNLTALSGVTIASWTRYQSYTGSIGLPFNNPLGYVEYRPLYLKLASSVNPALAAFPLILGPGVGSGPSLEQYDMQSYRTSLIATAAGSPSDADGYNVRLLGSNGLNAVQITGVAVGICMYPTEAFPNGATISQASVDGGGTLDMGSGCTFSGTGGGGTITITGGTSTMYNAPSTIVARNNATVTLAAQGGTYPSVSVTSGCTLNIAAAMTISVLSVTKSSNVDASGIVGVTVTITTSSLDGNDCQVNDPNNVVTWTNATTVSGQVTSGPFIFTGPRTVKVT